MQGFLKKRFQAGKNKDFLKLRGASIVLRLSCVELIIAHLGGQSHFQGGGGNCPPCPPPPPPPKKNWYVHVCTEKQSSQFCELSRVGCTVSTSVIQDSSRVTFKVTFGKKLHDSVNLLCFPRKMEAEQEYPAREMGSQVSDGALVEINVCSLPKGVHN